MKLWEYLALLLWGTLGCICSQDFYVAAPNTLRLNSDETVAVAIDGGSGAIVSVYVQDHPERLTNISETLVSVHSGIPALLTVRLKVDRFPPNFLTVPGSPKLVSLNVHFQDVHKEILIPISSSESGYVFIQTDKPIYTPQQNAFMRIISLTEDTLPSNEMFQLQIRNPDNIIVQEKMFNENKKRSHSVFANHVYRFPTYPVLGNWSATVRYGYNLNQNSTVHFQLREYVLPTFTVTLKTPDVILPSHRSVRIDVLAKYVYGRRVKGFVSFRLGVQRKYSHKEVFFAVSNPEELNKGTYTLSISTDELKSHKDVGWFPGIDESRLIVEATVVDYATGNKEVVTDSKAIFSKSLFVISFQRCLGDFRPGLTSVFVADIKYVDGRPAKGVVTKVRAVADDGIVLKADNKESRISSDEDGKVSIAIQPEIHHKSVNLTLETDDPRYEGNQAIGSFVQHAYKSDNKAYLALARKSLLRLRPGDTFGEVVHFEPAGVENIHYLVVARGKILSMKKLKPGKFKHQKLDFKITHDMVPSFRVLVFAHHGGELLADSLKIDVERACHPGAKVDVEPEFNQIEPEPGTSGKIVIHGTKGTSVGLLGVDEAVYALSKEDLLTKAKMFNTLESHDLGCGPGGGINVNSVLGNAGITIGTNIFTPSNTHSCAEVRRKKRAAAQEITKTYSERDKQCCGLGIEKDELGRTCEERVSIVETLDEAYSNCSKIFLDCCLQGKGGELTNLIMRQVNVRGRMAADIFDGMEFVDFEFDERDEWTAAKEVRTDFKETWIYENVIIGPDNQEEVFCSLPHSITTWVIQAVSVSPTHGICVAEPKKLVTFKKLFLHLNLPYSVVRNEQVEIQATVFNYGDRTASGSVFMLGTKDICSGVQPGEKSERKRILIEANSAATVTFPVIPLKAGEFDISVVVLTPMGSDAVQKKLRVVFEGIPKEIHVSVKLDPTNQQRRERRHIETPLYTDTIDTTHSLQVTAIQLSIPEEFVPGTASCSVRALGDIYGPAVETCIEHPDSLLIEPGGCGEQNMAKLAPTLYTMRYLKLTGKMTADREEKGYGFIRRGYDNQLQYRKGDGSYSAFKSSPSSTWLTAFVMKVFCQATALVHIDENVVCSGIRWLVSNQEPDGSFVEKHASYKSYLMGGVQGSVSMTAFALIALEECKCDGKNLTLAKIRAAAYLEERLDDVDMPLPTAVVAYALSLSNSDRKGAANAKLLAMAKYNESYNWMYWTTENSAQDIETTAYGLLTQLLFDDLTRSTAIVNWLNTKQQQSGAFKSTQDTVIALQALSEYAIRAQLPSINLVSNISSSNDRNFHRVMKFHTDNALVLQDVQVDRLGGTLFISTGGHGVGYLSVKLRYNLIGEMDDICKFDVTVNVTDAIIENEDSLDARRTQMLDRIPDNMLNGVRRKLGKEIPTDSSEKEVESIISRPRGRYWKEIPTDSSEKEEVESIISRPRGRYWKEIPADSSEKEEVKSIISRPRGRYWKEIPADSSEKEEVKSIISRPRGRYWKEIPADSSEKEEVESIISRPRGRDWRDFPTDNSEREEVESIIYRPGRRLRRRSRMQSHGENNKLYFNISVCVRYLGNEDAEMSIADVEIFSGFEPIEADLKKLERDPKHLIQRFEKSNTGVIFYLEKVPAEENYCFSFHVNRKYIVGKTQRSVIKVYDYYNPDASCVKFYDPPSNSPIIRTICEGGVCECAEGGCPPIKPFSDIADMKIGARREELKTILCENYDYVWNGSINGPVQRRGGFLNISLTVESVIKAGIEKAIDIEGETRTLLARDNCPVADLFPGVTYLILGKDGQAYKNAYEQTWYRYLLDKTSVVHLWILPRLAQDTNLQRDLQYVTRKLKADGCEM